MYAVGYFQGMWRVMTVDECYLPSSTEDKESRVEAYSILKGVMEAARGEADFIRKMLNRKAISTHPYQNHLAKEKSR